MAEPIVTGIDPSSGDPAGGTSVVISGSGFSGATDVGFGDADAADMSVDSDSQITAVSPGGSGTVDVTVITPAGTSETSAADQFTYVGLPVVSGIDPSSGDPAGGTSVVISGSGFSGATDVGFGDADAAD